MLFSVALFSSLLLVPVILAIPSGTPYSNNNWAGAAWANSNGTFNTVIGTFTVPTPSGPTGASAAAWIGIDGYTCTSAMFQTGIGFTVVGDQPIYSAWYRWFPDDARLFFDIDISPGDNIKLRVDAWSPTAGTAIIENLSNGQVVSESLSSSASLCGQNVEWVVEEYTLGVLPVPLADFGTVMFTSAVATGTGTYTPSGATILNISQYNQVLTSVAIDGTSVAIQYV